MEKKKILIVDDDTALADVLKHNLEATGKFEVRIENHGIFVYSAVLSFAPDLILLDLVLGDIAGTDVLTTIKEDEATKDIPIIFLTGMVRKEDESKIKSLSGFPYLAKPIDLKQLVESIEKALQK